MVRDGEALAYPKQKEKKKMRQTNDGQHLTISELEKQTCLIQTKIQKGRPQKEDKYFASIGEMSD